MQKWIQYLVLFISSVSSAGNFRDDLRHFRYAIEFSGFSDSKLEAYLNPLVGKTQYRLSERRTPWAGNYFPMSDGGLANRWQLASVKNFDSVGALNKDEILRMRIEEIDRLSPAEKYDLYRGDYRFTVTRRELETRGPLRANKPEDWEGFCNGVRCAGILMPEPKTEIFVTNPDGIKIPFKPADLKALAGANYFFVEKYAQLGAPSQSGTAESQPHPAVFDLALRYFVGLKRKAFVIDSNLGPEIWNESIIGFKRKLERGEALTQDEKLHYPQAKSKLKIQVSIETLGEMKIHESNQATKAKVAAGLAHETIETGYVLYLDSQGNAFDGYWLKNEVTGLRGIDFAWFGGGRGTDAEYPEQGGNPGLDHEVLKRLMIRSSKLKCENIFPH
jgi:hypothetical protein